MTPLAWIVVMSFAGGLLSVLVAAALSWAARPTWVPTLISYAIGALLGAAFLEVLPHAIEAAESPERAAMNILAGILIFFVLEKLVLWRHCHDEGCHGHGHDHHGHAVTEAHDHGRSGLLILVGDTFHNFVDGVLIAAAFVESTPLGIVTALAIIAHEIPQEAGDFVLLLAAGWSRKKAFMWNGLSSLASVIGGLTGYFWLADAQSWQPHVLVIAAASFIYLAVSDLMPWLRQETGDFAWHSGFMAAGIALVPTGIALLH